MTEKKNHITNSSGGGETDLQKMLAGAEAIRHAGTFLFCTLKMTDDASPPTTSHQSQLRIASEVSSSTSPSQSPSTLLLSRLLPSAVAIIKEEEGTTLVLPKPIAEAECHHFSTAPVFECVWLTLKVHSALNAVGLTAAFATALASNGISANVVAGFYHDHLFVGVEEADRAVSVLDELSRSHRNV
mmetsp:Transcript_29584/g.62320  ORF Transcript_29584/g.62320 Transcript_29584/m.62320 type:complete len:186 (+) Transcript_29584:173-730(+)